MIYLDSAATSFYKPPQVTQAVVKAMETMGNCSRGTGEPALHSARVIFKTRELLDEMFHGDGPEQVVFTANSTESLNIAIKGLVEPGDHVVTTALEHNSVLRPLYEMEEKGAKVTIIGCDSNGTLDYDSMEQALQPGVKALFCTHASNLTGNKVDLERIGRWCSKAGILFVVDASQTAGVFPIDMKKYHIDVLCFTGHKGLMGPQGTGGMCVRKGVNIRPLLTGGSGIKTYSKKHPDSMPVALEAGTLNGHGIAGLYAAASFIREIGMEQIRKKEEMLARTFYELVKDIEGVRIYGDFSCWDRAAIVTLNIGDADSGEISDILAMDYDIHTRSGGHCAPLMHQALGTADQGAVRFSFSYYNDFRQVEEAAQAVKELAEQYRDEKNY